MSCKINLAILNMSLSKRLCAIVTCLCFIWLSNSDNERKYLELKINIKRGDEVRWKKADQSRLVFG
jgi:hypothetical protein